MKKLLLGSSIINDFFQVLPITIFICLIYITIRIIYLNRKKLTINKKEEILCVLFLCYLSVLFNLVLVPPNFWHKIWNLILNGTNENLFSGLGEFTFNLIPTIYKVITGNYVLGSWVKLMIIGNTLMFVPLGFFLPLCFKKVNNKNIFIYALLIPFIIEFIQLFLGRSFDIDDYLMNSLGIIIGYLIIVILRKILTKKRKKV